MGRTDVVRVNIIVEGQTEREFVRDILRVALAHKEIYLEARAVETSRDKRANKIYRGGLLDYGRSRKDIARWLDQDKNAFVTTMFDLYALPKDFPGCREAMKFNDPYEKVACIEKALTTDIKHSRFIPYVQLHEFEALLFSDIDMLCSICDLNQQSKTSLQAVRSSFTTPEHINDHPDTAPSKRILNIHPSYEKITDGVRIIEAIGLDNLRHECHHFSAWLKKLESLVNS